MAELGGVLDNSRKFVMHWRGRCQRPCFSSMLLVEKVVDAGSPYPLGSEKARGFYPPQGEWVEVS